MMLILVWRTPHQKGFATFHKSKETREAAAEASLQNQEKVARDRQRKAQRKTKKDV